MGAKAIAQAKARLIYVVCQQPEPNTKERSVVCTTSFARGARLFIRHTRHSCFCSAQPKTPTEVGLWAYRSDEHQTERYLTEIHKFLLSASCDPSIGTEQNGRANSLQHHLPPSCSPDSHQSTKIPAQQLLSFRQPTQAIRPRSALAQLLSDNRQKRFSFSKR